METRKKLHFVYVFSCFSVFSSAVLLLAGCGGGEEAIEPGDVPPDVADTDAPPEDAAKEIPGPSQRPAKVGVGAKGHGYGSGPVTTPIAAYFSTRERIVFDIQIPSAMNTYRALHGRFPKTHEEFMEKIVRENRIRLPKLRAGERYVYDPQKAAKQSTYDPQDPPLVVERTR